MSEFRKETDSLVQVADEPRVGKHHDMCTTFRKFLVEGVATGS
jgi:hypothetical protein